MEDPQAKKPGYVVKLISGNANSKLARDIAKELGADIAECEVGKFSDGEIKIQIKHNVRGADAFVIQPTCGEVNNNLMELLLLLHTLKLSSAKRITAVVPYFGYARQDRKTRPRVPISASAVAQLIEAMGQCFSFSPPSLRSTQLTFILSFVGLQHTLLPHQHQQDHIDWSR
ncbi:Ribose-phosphate pyrophosphokinase [Balamuthia mandrillaris]